MNALLIALALGGLPGGAGCAPGPAVPAPRTAPAAPLRLSLNVPAFRLDVYEGDVRVRSDTVAVGARRYPTPTGHFRVEVVTWNPWWVPPPADWAKHEKVTPPGPENPLGKVKLRFRGDYYLHGTPFESSLGRAASHGCVRMANADAIELANRVQAAAGAPLPDAEARGLLAAWSPSRSVVLPSPVPLDVVYELAEVRDGALEIHPDVYQRGGDVGAMALRALEAAGLPPDRVDGARLRALVREGRTRSAAAPLAELDLADRPTSGGAPGAVPSAGRRR